MKQQDVVSLGIVGKESHFPLTGIFSATRTISVGKVSAVGRIHDADIKRDFKQTIEMSLELENLMANHTGTMKGLFRRIWDWYHERKPHSQIVCVVVQVITKEDELYLSMIGASGLWGLQEDVWYPLLADGSSVLQDKEIEGYPMVMQVYPLPNQIVAIPKPFQNVLPLESSFTKRVFEVNHVE
jgi:hypothetical protein